MVYLFKSKRVLFLFYKFRVLFTYRNKQVLFVYNYIIITPLSKNYLISDALKEHYKKRKSTIKAKLFIEIRLFIKKKFVDQINTRVYKPVENSR